MKPPLRTALWSIGTAVPRHRIRQEHALRFMCDTYRADARLERHLRYIYHRSQINFRHTCSADFAAEIMQRSVAGIDQTQYLLGDRSTAHRMQRYEEEIVGLAASAATTAFTHQTAFTLEEVTHLIVVTCTGFFAPGPEQHLIERLGLRRSVKRWQIGFMGCQAALQGLQAADAICRSDPAAVVLLVCAELCTLHFQRQPTEQNLVVNSLFADGAAAAVLSAKQSHGVPLCSLERFASQLEPTSDELISWRIGDRGFNMGLDMSVPQELARSLPAFVETLRQGVNDRVGAWAVHPGGRSVLDAVQRCLPLAGDDLATARQVLREYGNMSSPTVLFVLERMLARPQAPETLGVALTFGPGLSLEGMLLRYGNVC